MAQKIQLKRGLSSAIPSDADLGEPLFVQDSDEFYMGKGTGESLAHLVRKNNLIATTAPGPTNDISQRYTVGSMWVNISSGNVYMCVDSTTSAAVWKHLNATVNGAQGGLNVIGCRLLWKSDSSIAINTGSIELNGEVLSNDDEILLNWSNVEVGTVQAADTWYYVYIEKDLINEGNFKGFISDFPPTKDDDGNTINPYDQVAKFHPTKTARFVGSFLTDSSQNIISFIVVGNYINFRGVGYNYLIINGENTVKTAINCRDKVPMTSILANVYYELSWGYNPRYVGDFKTWILRSLLGSGEIMVPISCEDLALGKSASASSSKTTGTGPEKAVDGHRVETYWQAKQTTDQWLEIDLGTTYDVNAINIYEYENYITSYNVQYWNGSTWVDISTGTTISDGLLELEFSTINAQRFRIFIPTSSGGNPGIHEFEIINKDNCDVFYYECDGDNISLGIHGYYEDI